ncbi:hypothetical protein GGU11DRAFT_753523 [Lentinula aff. detonsa]|uniref:CCHC-type domain-containing protein n=1 Tax=Lentinula aff. detonsa TaxID=2804958 RepID=A0AA38KGJ5_9AGAR|nr:hypothetical protein GGU10DRAFT_432391 [Lentinula aff. detonsa]KAJ3801625.1 hypothetical protein GGU11DRAFT_753523 [Lentinula aff. detonsa]
MAQPEIIDLTLTSSQSSDALSDDSGVQIIPQLKKRKSSNRSRDNKDSTKKHRSETPLDDSKLFLVDSNPSDALRPTTLSTASEKSESHEGRLLLPAHVSVIGSVPIEIIAPASEDQDYVEYLDFGDPEELGITRYFQLEPSKTKAPSVNVCKRCGTKGEHKTRDCSVIICLTCGVRNEHTTHSCPISKVCFACGMKGHLSGSCPNRGKLANAYDDCDRCGSSSHATNECPTHWRIYHYVTDAARINTMEVRQAKKTRPLGQGGEGYIAEDSWCYNCGERGHWGDDCEITQHVYDIPDGNSAFGHTNLLTGPFSEIETGKTDRAPREWELDSPEWNDWGGRVPTNVGRQAKKKEMARMRANLLEDDEDDPFVRLAKPMRDGFKKNIGNGPKPPSQPKKMRFELNVKGAAKEAPQSLLSRISSDAVSKEFSRPQADNTDRRQHSSGRSNRDREKNGYHDRDRPKQDIRSKREKDRGRDRGREERGPRYKGGYSNGYFQ